MRITKRSVNGMYEQSLINRKSNQSHGNRSNNGQDQNQSQLQTQFMPQIGTIANNQQNPHLSIGQDQLKIVNMNKSVTRFKMQPQNLMSPVKASGHFNNSSTIQKAEIRNNKAAAFNSTNTIAMNGSGNMVGSIGSNPNVT